MRLVGPEDVDAALPYPKLIEALRSAFRDGVVQPVRHHHTVTRPGMQDATLLLMPAWTDMEKAGSAAGGYVGVKIVTVSPDNGAQGLPAVMGQYLLLAAATGEPLALIDGKRLTARRTAAASALAASYLAREDASRLMIFGAGALAPELAEAHASVRPIRHVTVWNRTPMAAKDLAEDLRSKGFEAEAAGDPQTAQGEADILSCCTLSTAPLVRGNLVKPGAHVDLVGAFTPAMRESDDDLMARAAVYCDTLDGALKEGGDLVQAMASGALKREHVCGDLYGLTRGEVSGRNDPAAITVFKSVGAALEDLAAAIAVYESVTC